MSGYAVPIYLPRRRRIVTPGEWLREKIEEQRRAREETIALATTTHRVATASTVGSTTYASGSFTPGANELLVALVVHTATTPDAAPTMTDSQSLGMTRVAVGTTQTNIRPYVFVSNALAAASSMTVTFTNASTTPTGAIIFVAGIAGMTKVGSAAFKQSAVQIGNNGGTPSCTFGASALTGNPTLGVVGNQANPANFTPPTSWTEPAGGDTGYATPTTGGEYVFRNSGFTGTVITWGSTSSGTYSALTVELDASAASTLHLLSALGAGG